MEVEVKVKAGVLGLIVVLARDRRAAKRVEAGTVSTLSRVET